MVKMNVTLGVDSKTMTWFRDYCLHQDAKMSHFVEKWIEKMREGIEDKEADDIIQCPNCHTYVSSAEWRKCFMACRNCKKLIMWPEVAAKVV